MAEPASRRHLVIRAPKPWAPVDLMELWEFRDLARAFAGRDIKLRYRQTALGVVWVLLQPLLAAGVFTFVFGEVAGLASEGVQYFAFSYAGLLAWNAFSGTLIKASGSLVANQAMVSKVFFPRLLLPLSVLGSTLIDFAVGSALMAALIAIYGIPVTLAMALAPLWLLILLTLATGLSLIASALMVRYRDVAYIVPMAVQLLLLASPVAYPTSAIPESAKPYAMANPLFGVLDAFRWSILGSNDLNLGGVVWSTITATGTLIIGLFIFTSFERDFADVI